MLADLRDIDFVLYEQMEADRLTSGDRSGKFNTKTV
ncbi:MAG: acyl-CoA dehydrogenase N-terminal domain-containing protein [Pseudomonadota bacterium]